MSTPFRAAALERYQAGRAEAALLSLGLPRVAPIAWALLAFSIALIALSLVVRMPSYVPGVAVVVQGRPGDADGVYAALLLPAEACPSSSLASRPISTWARMAPACAARPWRSSQTSSAPTACPAA